MGQVYHGLGLFARGETLLRKAIEFDERIFGADSLELAETLDALVYTLADRGQYDDAREWASRAVAIKERLLPPDDVRLAESLYWRGVSLMVGSSPRGVEGAALVERARRIFETRLGPDAIKVGWCWTSLAAERFRAGDLPGAIDLSRRSLSVKERALPPDHPDVALSLAALSYLLMRQGAYAEALPLLERALAIESKAYGEDHPDYGNTLQTLGELWWRSGNPEKALPILERAVAIRTKGLTPGDPDMAIDYLTLGSVLRDLHRYPEAEPYLRKALELAGSGGSMTPVTLAEAASEYAKLLRATGREAEARAVEARAAMQLHP